MQISSLPSTILNDCCIATKCSIPLSRSTQNEGGHPGSNAQSPFPVQSQTEGGENPNSIHNEGRIPDLMAVPPWFFYLKRRRIPDPIPISPLCSILDEGGTPGRMAISPLFLFTNNKKGYRIRRSRNHSLIICNTKGYPGSNAHSPSLILP